MAKESQEKKKSTLCVLNVLQEQTDKDHYLTQQEIADKVEEKYGLRLDRKAVSKAIRLLEDFNYDICSKSRGGYALIDRGFDETQIKYLIDSIYSSRSISPAQASELVEHLTGTLSEYQRENFQKIYKNYDVTRTDNKQLFQSIDRISEAMQKGMRTSFIYMTYNMKGELVPFRDKRYIVNPFYLVNNFGRYYLICTHFKHDDIRCYRVDFMQEVQVEDHLATPKEDIPSFRNFDINSYLSTHVYMQGGEPVKATLKLLRGDTSVRNLFDWFGKEASCHKDASGNIIAQVETATMNLVYWALQYPDDVMILGPDEVRNTMVEYVNKLKTSYGL